MNDIQKIIELIGTKFPQSISLPKALSKNPKPPATHVFRKAPDSPDFIFLFINNEEETWEVVKYECPSEDEMREFTSLWSKWGLYNKILDWKHEEINLI